MGMNYGQIKEEVESIQIMMGDSSSYSSDPQVFEAINRLATLVLELAASVQIMD
jgi:hypothetical protein